MREKIGINADSFTINGDLKLLAGFLASFVEAGFTYAEIPIHGLDCIVHGSLDRGRLAAAKSILKEYPLAYTVHSPDRLDLANVEHPAIHAAALEATIDFASEIGAPVVVYHGSSCSACDEETERLGKVAALAARRGVIVAVENIFRQNREEISYRIDPRDLAAQVAAVNSASLGICFDFGHGYISASEENIPYLDSFKAVLPRLVHVHIHDNFGKHVLPGTKTLDALFLGLGDLHLPPGEGSIPYTKLFPLFSPTYGGVYMMEIQPRFAPRYGEALGWIRRIIGNKESRS